LAFIVFFAAAWRNKDVYSQLFHGFPRSPPVKIRYGFGHDPAPHISASPPGALRRCTEQRHWWEDKNIIMFLFITLVLLECQM